MPPPWSSGPTFEINLESHVTGYRHKVLGLGLGPHVLLLLLLLVYNAEHTSGVNAAGESAHRAYEQAECWPDDSVMLQLKEHQYCRLGLGLGVEPCAAPVAPPPPNFFTRRRRRNFWPAPAQIGGVAENATVAERQSMIFLSTMW